MTVSELFIQWTTKVEDFCVIVHVVDNLHILQQWIGFAHQMQVKATLVKYKYKYETIGILRFVCLCASVFYSRRSCFHSSRRNDVLWTMTCGACRCAWSYIPINNMNHKYVAVLFTCCNMMIWRSRKTVYTSGSLQIPERLKIALCLLKSLATWNNWNDFKLVFYNF